MANKQKIALVIVFIGVFIATSALYKYAAAQDVHYRLGFGWIAVNSSCGVASSSSNQIENGYTMGSPFAFTTTDCGASTNNLARTLDNDGRLIWPVIVTFIVGVIMVATGWYKGRRHARA